MDNIRSYAVFNMVQCIVVFFILAGEAYVVTTAQYYQFQIICGTMGLVMCGTTFFFPYKAREAPQKEALPIEDEKL